MLLLAMFLMPSLLPLMRTKFLGYDGWARTSLIKTAFLIQLSSLSQYFPRCVCEQICTQTCHKQLTTYPALPPSTLPCFETLPKLLHISLSSTAIVGTWKQSIIPRALEKLPMTYKPSLTFCCCGGVFGNLMNAWMCCGMAPRKWVRYQHPEGWLISLSPFPPTLTEEEDFLTGMERWSKQLCGFFLQG